jgi:transport and Golgi organization protein 2
MCTVTFIPKADSYLLAMNRDDLYQRASSLPIVRAQFANHSAAYPQEAGGGTWVGANQYGSAFALLNWAVPPKGNKEKSRGGVIPQMLVATDLAQARIVFDSIDHHGTWPFRLIGIFHAGRAILEWRWDGEAARELSHEWGVRHWFSSGPSDEKAEQIRGDICAHCWQQEGAGTREWVRRLHAMHQPERGPFSICAHRDMGGTLSYTEIEVTRNAVGLAYSPIPPCNGVDFSEPVLMPRLTRSVALA